MARLCPGELTLIECTTRTHIPASKKERERDTEKERESEFVYFQASNVFLNDHYQVQPMKRVCVPTHSGVLLFRGNPASRVAAERRR